MPTLRLLVLVSSWELVMSDKPSMDQVAEHFENIPHVSRAPWTPEEVQSLNDYQDVKPMHPFTCGGGNTKDVHDHEVILVAQEDGWHCPECDYTQDWCWPWMASGEWKTLWTFAQSMEGEDV